MFDLRISVKSLIIPRNVRGEPFRGARYHSNDLKIDRDDSISEGGKDFHLTSSKTINLVPRVSLLRGRKDKRPWERGCKTISLACNRLKPLTVSRNIFYFADELQVIIATVFFLAEITLGQSIFMATASITVKPHRSRPHAIIHFIYKILALVVQSEVQFNAFVAEMSAQHFSGLVFPVSATQCAPDPLVAYFYAASVIYFRTT